MYAFLLAYVCMFVRICVCAPSMFFLIAVFVFYGSLGHNQFMCGTHASLYTSFGNSTSLFLFLSLSLFSLSLSLRVSLCSPRNIRGNTILWHVCRMIYMRENTKMNTASRRSCKSAILCNTNGKLFICGCKYYFVHDQSRALSPCPRWGLLQRTHCVTPGLWSPFSHTTATNSSMTGRQ